MADDHDPNGGTPPEGLRQARLPRWTRQEILVLIQGKRVAESRSRRGRGAAAAAAAAAAGSSEGLGIGSGQVEPKWETVSSYCRRHGVNRGPVQCRKRWSNLAGDYKKVKEWEGEAGKEGKESFWAMRNDLRRERKLPGFFDREVYDILDRGVDERAAAQVDVREEEKRTAVFDSGRSAAAAAEYELFSDGEAEETGTAGDRAEAAAAAAVPVSETQHDLILQTSEQPPGTATQKQPASGYEAGSSSRDTRKRKQSFPDGEDEGEPAATPELQGRMLDALERNGRLLTAQLESQERNLQLDRNQRRVQTDGLLSVLNKLADALGKIADKL